MRHILKFLRGAEGATAIEYALIAGIITVGILTTWTGISTKLSTEFSEVSSSFK